jgi:hypothetical protein
MEQNAISNINQIVKKTSDKNVFKESIKSGAKILSKNDFFKDFIGLMQNIEFDNFYNKYFKNWSDIQTMLFYMKLYKAVEYGYNDKFKKPIEPELMTFVLHKIMTENTLRKSAVQSFSTFKESSISDKEIFCKLLDYNALSSEQLTIKN